MPFLLIYFFTYLIFTPKVLNLHADLGGGAGGDSSSYCPKFIQTCTFIYIAGIRCLKYVLG